MSQMRTDILEHPPSLCNCRRVWHPCHTNAPYQGVQWSPLHQPSKNCTNQAATASSHSKRLLCILRVPWDNITQPKHLWASVPSVGGLFRAATRTLSGGALVSSAPTKLPLHPPTARDFCAFCGITRTLTFCAFCAFRGRIRSWQAAWVWQGCHTLLSVFCGQYISAWLVQQRLLHPLGEHL